MFMMSHVFISINLLPFFHIYDTVTTCDLNNMALPTATPTSPPIVAPPTVAQSTIPSNENSLRCLLPYCELGQNDPPGRYSKLKGGPDYSNNKTEIFCLFLIRLLSQ